MQLESSKLLKQLHCNKKQATVWFVCPISFNDAADITMLILIIQIILALLSFLYNSE